MNRMMMRSNFHDAGPPKVADACRVQGCIRPLTRDCVLAAHDSLVNMMCSCQPSPAEVVCKGTMLHQLHPSMRRDAELLAL